MSQKIGLFVGSFDPITYGHLDIIHRAAKLFDKLYVAPMTNTSKKYLFTYEEKKAFIEKEITDLDNVEVVDAKGELTVKLAEKLGVNFLVRSMRTADDFKYESGVAAINQILDKKIETIFLLANSKYATISSSMMKEVASFGGDISGFVPPAVAQALIEKYRKDQPILKFNKTRNKIFGAIFIFIIVVAFFMMPTGYYLEVPGTAEDTSQFVKVAGKHDKKKGNLLLTTVGIVTGTPFTMLKSLGNNFETVYSQQDLMGDENSQQYFQVQRYAMKSAQNNAIQAAYSKADKQFTKKYLGVYVLNVTDNSDFKNKLEVGDTITSINGYHFNNADQFIKYVKKQDKHSKVKISFMRDDKQKSASGKLVKLPSLKRYGLGITLTDNTEAVGNPPTKINAGNIGGPSAGLMFTLQVYSQVANKDLKAGRTIAGTGTIDPDGTVGPIGGIEKKVYAASEEGATIFLAPDDPVTKEIKKYDPHYVNNYHLALRAAKKLHTKMKIVPVKSLNDAINYLEKTK